MGNKDIHSHLLALSPSMEGACILMPKGSSDSGLGFLDFNKLPHMNVLGDLNTVHQSLCPFFFVLVFKLPHDSLLQSINIATPRER